MTPESLLNSYRDVLALPVAAADTSCVVSLGAPAEAVGQTVRMAISHLGNTEFVTATLDTETGWTIRRAVEDWGRFPARDWPAGARVEAVLTRAGLAATPTYPEPTVFCRTLPPGSRCFDTSGSNSASRDPRPYYDPGFDGIGNDYIVSRDLVTGAGYGTGVWQLGWAVGKTLDSLTDRGVYIDPADLDPARPSAGSGTFFRDFGGRCYVLLSCVNLWGPPTLANIRLLSADTFVDPDDPTQPPAFTDHGVIVADGTNRYTDVSDIVYYNGSYRFACIEYTGMSGASRRVVFFTSATLAGGGLWSRTATPNQTGGSNLGASVDSPSLWVSRGRLFMSTTPAGTKNDLWDVSRVFDGGWAQYLGPCIMATTYEGAATGSQPDWTMTGTCVGPGGVIEGLVQDGTPYSKQFPVRLVGYPRRVAGTYNTFRSVSSGLSGSSTVASALTWGTIVPECTYEVGICLQVLENGTHTPGEYVKIQTNDSTFPVQGAVFPLVGGGVNHSGLGRVYLKPSDQRMLLAYSQLGNALVNYVITDTTSLPE